MIEYHKLNERLIAKRTLGYLDEDKPRELFYREIIIEWNMSYCATYLVKN